VRLTVVVVAALAALAACSLGRDSEEVASDPPVVVGDAAAGDSTETSSSSSSSGSSGGGVDAAVADADADAGSLRWCADPARGTFLFCADFDGTSLTEGFFPVATMASIDPETMELRSAPRAVRLKHPARAGTGYDEVQLAANVVRPAIVRVEVDVRVMNDIANVASPEEIVILSLPGDVPSGCFLSAKEIICGTNGAYTRQSLSLTPVIGTWQHWEIKLSTAGSAATAEVKRDGALSATVTGQVQFDNGFDLHLGPHQIPLGYEWDVIYDNVLVTEVK
jgi:hypothetical protein